MLVCRTLDKEVKGSILMATCSAILIRRLAIDKTDRTVIDVHTDHFSNTVRKLGQEMVWLA